MPSSAIAGLVLTLITVFAFITQIVVHPYVKKITNSYVFWLSVSLVLLIYCYVLRFVPDWKNLSYYLSTGINPHPELSVSRIFSRALLLDFCPFLFVFSTFFLIVDPSRKIAGYFAPILLFGGLITICAKILPGDDGSASLTFEYIFIGANPNTLFFIMHFLNVLLGVGILLNTPNLKWKNFIWTNVVFIIFFSYVGIVAYSIGLDAGASGLVHGDWEFGGEYYMISKLLNMKFPYVVIIPLLICYFFNSLIIWLNYLFQKKIKKYYINKDKNKKWFFGYYLI